MMEYKGYLANVRFDEQANLFHGEVMNIRDVVTFQGKTVDQLRRAFRDSVEDYLAFCAARGEAAEKPFSGKFVVRISPELHRKIVIAAATEGKSLNRWIATRLSHGVRSAKRSHITRSPGVSVRSAGPQVSSGRPARR